ncbi:metal-dependent hydrolase [Salinirubrum litoreum]|uniref:Metal-dependent hydrolase n=1 Tax=Salinirubrum litoreum TaxID=1126234 RepID=A0ABD5RC84_9EURY|nr:metal-dependent hydrolase [Salinirubrum litoreum]
MWPWEHLAFGYLWYSVLTRLAGDHRVGDAEAVALGVGTVLPDLVDKPLSWSLGVTATGYGPAHSLFVGAPLVAALAALAWRRGHGPPGAAFAVGYASHLLGDVLAFRADGPVLSKLLWPAAAQEPYTVDRSLLGRAGSYFGEFLATATQPDHLALALGYAGVLVAVVLLWAADGAPGVHWLRGDVDGRR